MKLPSESDGVQTPASLVARTGDYGVLRLTVRGFDALSDRDKALAYHLSRAAALGRDITWDQRHHLALALRTELETMYNKSHAVGGDFAKKLQTTLRLLWIASGPYDTHSGQKIHMQFTETEWRRARKLIGQRRSKPPAKPPATTPSDEMLVSFMFDPEVDSRLIGPDGRDPFAGSSGNFYRNIKLDDLNGLTERNALNSRLERHGDRVIELVYRTGRAAKPGQRPAPRGLYADLLTAVVQELRRALTLTDIRQRAHLQHLIDYFESGAPTDFDKYSQTWVRLRPSVDSIIGFIETDDDPRGVKGTWEGLVLIPDRSVQALFDGLRTNAAYFESTMPWSDEYKCESPTYPMHEAWQVIAAHGDAGPDIPHGTNLPNSDTIRTNTGHRSLLFTNVIRAADEATESLLLDIFAPVEERTAARKCAGINSDLTLALHEIVGHGSGQMSVKLADTSPDTYLKELATAIEELRAELVAMTLLWDPKVRELSPLYTDECAEAAWRSLVRRDLTMLRQVSGERLEDDHMRATHAIVSHARAAGAVERVRRGTSTYLVITDMEKMRNTLNELLVDVMRIRAEGDYKGARALFEAHGFFFDKSLRDEVLVRAAPLELPVHYAFVLPRLVATFDALGIATTATLQPTSDFDAQMLRLSAGK